MDVSPLLVTQPRSNRVKAVTVAVISFMALVAVTILLSNAASNDAQSSIDTQMDDLVVSKIQQHKLSEKENDLFQGMFDSPKAIPSSGCSNGGHHVGSWKDGEVVHVDTPTGKREFIYRAPLNTSVPSALVVVFHSYYYNMHFVQDWSEWTTFRDANPTLPLAILYPNGEGDSLMRQKGDEPIRGWNSLGNSAGGTSTCNVKQATAAGGYPGYASCVKQGHQVHGAKAAGCDSGPCCDDVAFVAQIVEMTMENTCIDKRRVYASGQSNGGMMTEQVGEDIRTAHLFAGGVQVSGAPLYGYNQPPVGAYSLLSLRGRQDSTIPFASSAESPQIKQMIISGETTPPEGTTVSSDGFYYVTEKNVMSVWSQALECKNPKGIPYNPPGDGKYWASGISLTCWEYGPCRAGAGLVSCTFQGGHSMPWNDCAGRDSYGQVSCLAKNSWFHLQEKGDSEKVYAHHVFNRLALRFMLEHPKLSPAPPPVQSTSMETGVGATSLSQGDIICLLIAVFVGSVLIGTAVLLLFVPKQVHAG